MYICVRVYARVRACACARVVYVCACVRACVRGETLIVHKNKQSLKTK